MNVHFNIRSSCLVLLMLLTAFTLISCHDGNDEGDHHVIRDGSDLTENPNSLSPPIVEEPLYACGKSVVVKGFIPKARIDIYANGALIGGATSNSPSGQVFSVAPALADGQIITATQTFDGTTSGSSNEVVVKLHTEDYPDGVPKPYIDPTPLYDCGKQTGVRDVVTGAHLQVFSETPIPAGGYEAPVVVGEDGSSGAAQAVNINPQFSTDNRVTAQYFVCEDEAPPLKEDSPVSDPERVVNEPAVIPPPMVDEVYEGSDVVTVRDILNGAYVEIFANGSKISEGAAAGGGKKFRINPVAVDGETITATQTLCTPSGPSPGVTVKPCSELPAARIKTPEAGDDQIEVTEYVSGSRIIIFANGQEVGDGGGAVIQLIRPLRIGETVIVVQRLGDCQSQWVYRIDVECVAPDKIHNPSGSGSYEVGTLDYSRPAVSIRSDSVRIIATVRYPAQTTGANTEIADGSVKFPFVLFLHGNHGTCRISGEDVCLGYGETCDTTEAPSHEGYNYVLESLAKGGFIAISINGNDLNCLSDRIGERGTLILEHLRLWKTLNDPTAADPLFGGKFHNRVDLDKIGLAGHSRGGEAVVSAAIDNADPELTIKSILSIAPVDGHGYTLSALPILMLLPSADGDVWDNAGSRIYDRARKGPSEEWFKSQMYIYGANHNFFNSQWLSDDGGGPDRLTRGQQEAMLRTWSRTFFELTLKNRDIYLPIYSGDEYVNGISNDVIYHSYQHAHSRQVDDFEDSPDDAAQNSINGAVNDSGFMTFDEYVFMHEYPARYGYPPVPDRYNNSFYHETDGLVATWQGDSAEFTSEVPTANSDNSDYEYLSIRSAQISDRLNNSSREMKFDIWLEDSNGAQVKVDSETIGVLPFPYAHPDGAKTMMRTLRIPLACFDNVTTGQVDHSKISKLKFEFTELSTGAIALDQFEFSD